jgi:hypothetical protein
MFCNFYLVKNHKSASNPTTTEAGEKYAQILNARKFIIFYACLTKIKMNQILLNKNSILIQLKVHLHVRFLNKIVPFPNVILFMQMHKPNATSDSPVNDQLYSSRNSKDIIQFFLI